MLVVISWGRKKEEKRGKKSKIKRGSRENKGGRREKIIRTKGKNESQNVST